MAAALPSLKGTVAVKAHYRAELPIDGAVNVGPVEVEGHQGLLRVSPDTGYGAALEGSRRCQSMAVGRLGDVQEVGCSAVGK